MGHPDQKYLGLSEFVPCAMCRDEAFEGISGVEQANRAIYVGTLKVKARAVFPYG